MDSCSAQSRLRSQLYSVTLLAELAHYCCECGTDVSGWCCVSTGLAASSSDVGLDAGHWSGSARHWVHFVVGGALPVREIADAVSGQARSSDARSCIENPEPDLCVWVLRHCGD